MTPHRALVIEWLCAGASFAEYRENARLGLFFLQNIVRMQGAVDRIQGSFGII